MPDEITNLREALTGLEIADCKRTRCGLFDSRPTPECSVCRDGKINAVMQVLAAQRVGVMGDCYAIQDELMAKPMHLYKVIPIKDTGTDGTDGTADKPEAL